MWETEDEAMRSVRSGQAVAHFLEPPLRSGSVDANGRSGFLFFVWAPTGYTLVERTGEPPRLGTVIEDGEGRYVVAKIAPSPLPGDGRRCAYLLPV